MIRFYCFFAIISFWGCSGPQKLGPAVESVGVSGPGKIASGALLLELIAPEDKLLFADLEEHLQAGVENLQDSLWFEAGERLDSAMVQVILLETSDSLKDGSRTALAVYRDSLKTLMLHAVAQSSLMGEPVPWSAYFDDSMERMPDSATETADSLAENINVSSYDLPLELPLNPRILQAIAVFTGPGRGYFSKWLNRRSRYEQLFHEKLEAAGMPKDLLYLSMIESGFNPKAWSTASASGLWQFISGTGRRYGLHDDWWIDMRRDPAHATDAAIRYLKDLHAEFGDWYMAMAAYNCGEGRIRRYLAEDPTRTYWDMPVPRETRYYVPKILAAMIIGHDPEKYGFTIDDPAPPLVYDTAKIEHCLSIKTIAQAAGALENTIIELNPALRRWCSPPNRSSHIVNLPPGTRETFLANYEALDKDKLASWHQHRVLRGENLGLISKKYNTSVAAIRTANKLNSNVIRPGQVLIIPMSPESAVAVAEATESKSAPVPRFAGGTYTVKPGDNLFDIAQKLKISFADLLNANGLTRKSVIKPGQKLKLAESSSVATAPQPASAPDNASVKVSPPPVTAKSGSPEGKFLEHSIKPSETLYSIARQLNVTVDELKAWNGMQGDVIQAGRKLRYLAQAGAPEKGARISEPSRVHEVKSGESVYLIARLHDTTQQAILDLNGLSADTPIHPGDRLIVARNETRPRADEATYYTVKSGDTLWDISVRFNSSVKQLRQLNEDLPRVLKPGVRIRVQ